MENDLNKKMVFLGGPRQVGKTTLARQLAAQLPKPTQYFDLEYPENWAALQEPVRLLERLIPQFEKLKPGARMPSYERLDGATLEALGDWLGSLR